MSNNFGFRFTRTDIIDGIAATIKTDVDIKRFRKEELIEFVEGCVQKQKRLIKSNMTIMRDKEKEIHGL